MTVNGQSDAQINARQFALSMAVQQHKTDNVSNEDVAKTADLFYGLLGDTDEQSNAVQNAKQHALKMAVERHKSSEAWNHVRHVTDAFHKFFEFLNSDTKKEPE